MRAVVTTGRGVMDLDDVPPPGDGLLYLVSVRTLGGEGSLGSGTDGPRPNPNPCP